MWSLDQHHRCPLGIQEMENLNLLLNKILCRLKVGKHSWLVEVNSTSKSYYCPFYGKENRPKQKRADPNDYRNKRGYDYQQGALTHAIAAAPVLTAAESRSNSKVSQRMGGCTMRSVHTMEYYSATKKE